jgi:DNA-binding winged helix-turn-helix (wHTH) protein/TolB-like protein/Flp pilus assembly protein TadD
VIYQFGDFRLDPAQRLLTRDAQPVAMTPKAFDLLVYFVEHHGRLVEKSTLMAALWPDTIVEEANLAFQVSALRKALDDGGAGDALIQTVPTKGYRFVAEVTRRGVDADQTSAHEQMRWRSRKMGLWAISLAAVIVVGVVVMNRLRADRQVPRVTIAVLPFEHLGGPEREYLTDGLTEETSASLGQIDPEHLSVKGRQSTRRYKNTAKSLAEIGQELGVEYLVEGSVRAESSRLRVTAMLIRARDQTQVWSESFESEPGSMLELQRELSAAIARQVGLRLSPDRLTALAPRHTRNAEAYDLYLRGRYFWNQLTPETNRRAVESYQKATQLDSTFALAWAGLADIYSTSPITSDVPPRDVSAKAREAAAHAVASGPDLAETQTALGTVHFWLDWDWPAADVAFRKAISADPAYAQAHRNLGLVLAAMGRHDEARDAMSHARKLEPFYPMQTAISAYERKMARDYPSALEFARRATGVDPKFWIGNYLLAEVYERLGNSDLALEALAKAEAASGNSKMLSLRGYILARSGRTKQAEEVLRTLKSIGHERYVPPYAMALVYAGLGQHDSAFEWLEKAYEVRDVHLRDVAAQDPNWDDLREDPRFRRLVERCDFMRTANTGRHTEQ